MSQTFLYFSLSRILGKLRFPLFICLIFLFGESLLNPTAAEFGREVAPDFEVSTLEGQYVSRFNLEGEQTLIMFWAPWCGVCRGELPKLAQYYHDDMPYNLQVLTIGTSASHREVKQYVREHPGTFIFPTAYDSNKTIAGDFGIRAFPTYVLLDRDGSILLVHRGSGILNDQEFHQLVQ